MTERLYYTDCYLQKFRARVVEASHDGCRVYLDRSAFYPASGGQPHDLGFVEGQPVVEVVDEEDRIAHVVASPVLSSLVDCAVDWPRRYDHMQQHTGQHLLSAVWRELFGFPTLSFHMGGEVSTIELGAGELRDSQIDAAEARANAIVREARPVTIGFTEAEAVEGLRKPSAREGTIRIVEIEGLDRSACGGTHVRSTAGTGPIQMRRVEKIRGNIRIEFVCGERALRRAKADYRICSELSRVAGASVDALPEAVSSLRSRLTAAEKEKQRLESEVARFEGVALYRQIDASLDGIRRIRLEVPIINDAVRAKLQAFAGQGRALAIAVGPAGVLIACSENSGFNAGAIVKAALPRGGGSATLAQASLPDLSFVVQLEEALGFGAG